MPNLLTGNVNRFRPIVVALALSLAMLAVPASAQNPARIVAVGDVHGDYDSFVAILQQAEIIDSHLHWAGKNTTLVQSGDFLDRGPKSREVMDLLMALEVEAPLKGGRVVVLMGNHEAMNIIGDLRYAAPMYPSFVDKSSEKRRKAAYDAFAAWQKARIAAGRLPATEPAPDAEATWMAAHPLGYVEQRDAMSPSGKYGSWLRERPPLVQIGSTLFVHGGISPVLAGWKANAIVDRVRSEVKAQDDLRQRFEQQKIILDSFNMEETVAAVRAELDFRNAELAQKTAEAERNPKGSKQSFESEKKQIQYLTMFLGFGSWFIVHPDGPLWFRGYAQWSDAEGTEQVTKELESLGVSHIVVGHSAQQGRIVPRFDGKVFLIDTGMLSTSFSGGRASALEIVAGKFTAIYSDQRIVLLDPNARKEGAVVPASHEEQLSEEIPGGGTEAADQGTQDPPAKEPAPAAAQENAQPARVWYDPDGKPLPFKSDDEVLEFLRTAKAGKMKGTSKGITHPRETILEKDGLRLHAKFSTFAEEKDMAQLASGERVINFKDSYVFEAASYELSRMLGMDCIPPTVLRSLNGEKGALQAWVENAFDEGKRQKEKIAPLHAREWNEQIQTMRFFDNLVDNFDRNVGNILIDKNWKVWLIDCTRCFRRSDKLQNADSLVEIDRGTWEKLLALDEKTMKDRLKPYLTSFELDSLFKRRKKIIEVYQDQIAKRGESEVIRENKN